MRTVVRALCVLALVAAVPTAITAQWPNYPTPGVPKTPDGKPNLTAPTPRTADGKPDLSGLWSRGGGVGGGQRGGAAQGAQGGQAQGAAAPADGVPRATFGNAGQGFPDDLPFQPWAAELMKQRRADGSKDNPDAHCLPMGFLQFHNHPQPRQMIQTPRSLVILYEANHGLRQIFTDGRPLPNKDDVEPWYYGYSVGRWEGDTLVVETTGFTDLQWLDVRGSPLTSQAKVTERFRRPNYGSLEIEITVDDPKAYTKPWTTKLNQRIMLDTDLFEFICEERDAKHYVGADGK